MNVLKQAVLGMSSSSANERLQNESSQLFKRKTAIMNRSEKDDSPNIIGEKSIVSFWLHSLSMLCFNEYRLVFQVF